jgi:hypothetical protein
MALARASLGFETHSVQITPTAGKVIVDQLDDRAGVKGFFLTDAARIARDSGPNRRNAAIKLMRT